MTSSIAVVAELLMVLAASTATADPAMEAPVIGFWAGPGAENDKRVIKIEDHHACSGRRAYAHVIEMPDPESNGSLQPELVVELSLSGAVIRQWAMPIDETVLGIRGDRIIVSYGEDPTDEAKVLMISLNRSFSVASLPSMLKTSNAFECPHLTQFGDSAYIRCFEYFDPESNEVHRLAYQGPCT